MNHTILIISVRFYLILEEVTRFNPRRLSYVPLIRATSIILRITARFIQPTLSPSATSALRSCYLPVESLTRNLISDL